MSGNDMYCKEHKCCFVANGNMVFYCPECMKIEVQKHQKCMQELLNGEVSL